MESLLDFALQERYKKVSELGDKVAEFDTFRTYAVELV